MTTIANKRRMVKPDGVILFVYNTILDSPLLSLWK
jgi:hypothetical protein